MRIFFGTLILIALIVFNPGCTGKGNSKKDSQITSDTITVPDTGYTGIKQYFSGATLVKEVTFRNGVREGLMKAFYVTKQVRQTFWYHNGLREDSAKWYYLEGPVFRATPYKRDTIDGIQQQYFKNGRIKARLGFRKGLRTTFFEEYNSAGKIIDGYPELIVNIKDDYSARGIYRISLELSKKATKVRYYRSDISAGVFDTAHCSPVKTVNGKGILDLKKTSSSQKTSIDIIAEILTGYGNNYLIFKKIDLPYNDLN